MAEKQEKTQEDSLVKALKPQYRAVYGQKAKELGYSPYIDLDYRKPTGDAVFKKGEDNKLEFIIPRTAVVWTPELVREHFQVPNSYIAGAPKPEPAIQAMVDTMAKQAGIEKPITVILTDTFKGTGTGQTQEGENYLILERHYLINPNIKGVVAHEIGHIKNSDHTAERTARLFNQPDGGLADQSHFESRADRFAAEHCHGPAFASVMQQHYAGALAELQKQGKTAEEGFANNLHTPNPQLRLEALLEASRKAVEAGLCKPQEALPPGQAPSTPARPVGQTPSQTR